MSLKRVSAPIAVGNVTKCVSCVKGAAISVYRKRVVIATQRRVRSVWIVNRECVAGVRHITAYVKCEIFKCFGGE